MTDQVNQFEGWCIIELFGHQRMAGYCTEQNVAGTNMLRVDVPAAKNSPAFTRFLGSGAIYSILPVAEDIARAMVNRLQVVPVESWELSKLELPSETLKMIEVAEKARRFANDDEDDDDGDY